MQQKLEGEETVSEQKEDDYMKDVQPEISKVEENVSVETKPEEKEEKQKEEVVDDYMAEVFKDLEIYYSEVAESEGFEVGEHKILHGEMMGAIYRYYAPPDKEIYDEKLKADLYKLAQAAMDYYNNQQNTSYGNVHVLKANTEPTKGTLFYITFEATNNESTETFQAKVYSGVPSSHVEVKFVRVKPNKITN